MVAGRGLAWSLAAMAGVSGLIGGVNGVYDWRSAKGWLAFVADSSWGVFGTTLANVVHMVNRLWPDADYRRDLSARQDRHLYAGGARLKGPLAFTVGNVISNAALGRAEVNESFITNHEELHIWQSRVFGPLFLLTYISWAVAGALVATVYWGFHRDRHWATLVETVAYYDNPFEYWAYKNDHNWPPRSADPSLRWGPGHDHQTDQK